ncbi:hypothetical protein SCP_0404840 [Sparassis crispa]|uniref:MFS general substrate transporter n=1 Tax=Sparassis crispa TaxID=139825 RepID=A0A401GIS5_9APHY|nr:hypothetical protein SCP_0404840 [Sparassis crispa]GBE82104.1 hypothetical protein SCP_0404840 [Sparassis crispa]
MSRSKDNSRLRVPGASKSSSRPGSRLRTSRNPSLSSLSYIPFGPEELINPDAPVSEEVAELLQEFVHPHRHESEQTLVQEAADEVCADDEIDTAKQPLDLPWWKRPSPWWFLVLIIISSVAAGATMAPRVSVYTRLACDTYKPEYSRVGRNPDNLTLLSPHANNMSSVVPSGGMASTPPSDRDWALCASDPVVQAAVAKLSLVIAASTGILGCITTTMWASLSDRYGRVRIAGISTIGILVTELGFLLVYNFPNSVPGGIWFLVLGPIIDGLLGGIGAVSSAIHAYLTDCTEPSSRSRIFSLFMGLLFAGISIGPTLGSLTINLTGNIISVFYISFCTYLILCLFLWVVIPESLTKAQRAEARRLHAEDSARLAIARSKGGLLTWLGRPFDFLRPLALFYPMVIDDSASKKRRDWSLLLLVAGCGCTGSLIGGLTYKMQYMSSVFGWTAAEIGYWSSSVGASRAIHLTLVLPLLTKLFQPKPSAIMLPIEPLEPLRPETASSESLAPQETAPPPHQPHSPHFDLVIARCSLLLEISSYILMAFTRTGGLFTFFGIMSSLGAGYGPAISSVASTLYATRGGKEMGKLFGAMSVIQTLSSQVLGPTIFAFTYMATVAIFPPAIFFVSAGVLSVAFILFLFIRLPKMPQEASDVDVEDPLANHPTLRREETLTDVEEVLIVVDDEDRGKKVTP